MKIVRVYHNFKFLNDARLLGFGRVSGMMAQVMSVGHRLRRDKALSHAEGDDLLDVAPEAVTYREKGAPPDGNDKYATRAF